MLQDVVFRLRLHDSKCHMTLYDALNNALRGIQECPGDFWKYATHESNHQMKIETSLS